MWKLVGAVGAMAMAVTLASRINMGIVSVWAVAFIAVMAAICWRLVGRQARRRRCTVAVRAMCVGTQNGTWTHGDAGDQTQVSRPIYRYEHNGTRYESAAGTSTMLFELSPTAKRQGEEVELYVSPSNPAEAYDPEYERWFARYRVIWGITAFVGLFALVSVLGMLG